MPILTLLSVPIGNMGDLTPRVLEALKEGTLFFAEDTRTFFSLLNLLGISKEGKSVISFHDQTEEGKLTQYVSRIEEHGKAYLVSEAGSPMISDPAFPLVRECLKREIELQSFPGVSSVNVALELSGLPPHPFHFWGFFPRESKGKKELFQRVSKIQGTHIFFESPHRVMDTVELGCKELPGVQHVLARELTKKFESVYRFYSEEFSEAQSKITVKGEFVYLLHIKDVSTKSVELDKLEKLASTYLHEKRTPKSLSKLLSEILGVSVKDVYKELSK